MEEDFIKLWKSLRLIDTKRLEVSIAQEFPEEIIHIKHLSLLGLVVVEKAINKETFRSTMKCIWKTKGKVELKEVGFNMFVVTFHNKLDLHRVQEGCPWTFDRHLLFS